MTDVRVESHDPEASKVVVVDVQQSADSDAPPTAVRDALLATLDHGYKFILLNVESVTAVDSLWLGALVQGYVSAIRRGGTVKLLHATRKLRDLLRVTKLDTVLDNFESEDVAKASFEEHDRAPK
jgi:anti-anti-sigma factor